MNQCRLFRTVRRFYSETKSMQESTVSYLYIGRGRQTPFTVEPNLDFRERFENLPKLKLLVENRKTKLLMSVDRLADEYSKVFPVLKRHRSLTKELASLKDRQRKENNASDETNNSKIDSFKSELKSLTFNADTEKILLECLKLPNNISVDTPIGENSFLINRYDPQEQRRCDHSYFLINRRLVDLRKNPDRLYMIGAAADIYYKIEDLVRLSFDRFQYRLISPSNFLRTSIAEALEVVDLSEVEQIYQSIASIFGVDGQDTVWGLNLSGHCLGSYLALFVEKRLSENNQLPIIFSSIGTSYKSSKTSDSSTVRWLSNHIQRPVATIFVLFSSGDQRETVENRLISDIDKILTSFDINWKKYLASSERLKSAEMKRLDWITVTGPVLDGVRCAHVAFYGDFLSKRLRFTYKSNKSDWTYLHLAYAEIDLYNIFGAVIERCIDESSEKVDLNLFSALVDKNFAHLLN